MSRKIPDSLINQLSDEAHSAIESAASGAGAVASSVDIGIDATDTRAESKESATNVSCYRY